MCKSPEHQKIPPVPSTPPLPPKMQEIEEASQSSQSTKSSKKSKKSSKISSMMPKRLSNGSMKKAKEEKRRSKSVKPSNDDPFLPKRIAKSKSLNEKIDKPSAGKSRKITRISAKKSASFSGEFTAKKISRNTSGSLRKDRTISRTDSGSLRSTRSISRNDSGSLRSTRSISRTDSGSLRSTRSIGSRTSITSSKSAPEALSVPQRRKPERRKSSKAKKAKEEKDQAVLDFLVSGDATRKVRFEDKVRCRKINQSQFDREAMWWSDLEIMGHRKREQMAHREARNATNLDLEGMFSIKERNVRNSRMLQAFEAVFDAQMINKKEKELEAAVGLFRGGLYMEALEGDYEDSMAAEYMNVAAPALESAVLRAAHLQVHVHLLWEEPSPEAARKAARAARKDAAPSIPKRKVSNRNKSKSLLLEAAAPSIPTRKMSSRTKSKSLLLESESSHHHVLIAQ